MKSLQTLIDFEYELYEAPDKEYGRINDDMEWNGAVKEIIDEVQHVNDILVAIENPLDNYNTVMKYICQCQNTFPRMQISYWEHLL